MPRHAAPRRWRISPRSPPTAAAARPGEATANATRQLDAMRHHLDPPHAAVISGATGVAAADAGGTRVPARPRPAGARPAPRRSATRWSRRSPPTWRWPRWRCRERRLFAPLEPDEAADGQRRCARCWSPSWGHWRGEALARGRSGIGGSMGRADLDSRGRPVVVVTGIGVLTSLGAGQAGQLARTHRGAVRHPAHLAASRSTGCAPPSPARSTSCRSRSCRRRRLSERLAELVIEEAVAEAGIGTPGDFPGPMFLALPPVEMEWPQRLAARRGVGRERDRRLR